MFRNNKIYYRIFSVRCQLFIGKFSKKIRKETVYVPKD